MRVRASVSSGGGGGGGSATVTELWANASTSSTFGEQTISLSDDINNYDDIQIAYKLKNDYANATYTTRVKSSVVDYIANGNSSAVKNKLSLCGRGPNYLFFRYVSYATDTSIFISSAYRADGSQTNNAYIIPISVEGIKY